ncbi:conserved Plasmodium protein, unknown function, partial [Plasmodium sp. DRC-Itaito]
SSNIIGSSNIMDSSNKGNNKIDNHFNINIQNDDPNINNNINNLKKCESSINNHVIQATTELNNNNDIYHIKNNTPTYSNIKEEVESNLINKEENKSNILNDVLLNTMNNDINKHEEEHIILNCNIVNNNLLDLSNERIKNVCLDLSKINIKCIKVVYGMKHFFCSYDTQEISDPYFEIIKVQKKYDILRRKSIEKMNLRGANNPYPSSRRLLNNTNNNNDNNNNVKGKNNFLLRASVISSSKDDPKKRNSQYGKQRKQNEEDDYSMKHEKYNYVNFNLSYKTLRKKMICLRHYANANSNTSTSTNANVNPNTSTSTNTHTNINVYKKEENKTIKVKTEIKIKDKFLTQTNESLIQTSSINSNFSNIISVDGFSSINLESHCSQKSA